MTESEFRCWLANDVYKIGSQKEAARIYRVSAPYLSDVLKGNREPGAKLLEGVGFEKIVTYQRKGTGTE